MDNQIIIYEEKKSQQNNIIHLWVPQYFWFKEPYSYHFPDFIIPKIEIPKEIPFKLCDQMDIKKI